MAKSKTLTRSRTHPPHPTDRALYQQVKARIYNQNPTHSAYRSGMMVKAYKKDFGKKYGSSRSPYIGQRREGSLSRWFKEKWVNQRGEVGYRYKSDVYRPSVRVNRRTPKTYRELSRSALQRARRQKSRTGHVDRF
jgi:hypothetical protein